MCLIRSSRLPLPWSSLGWGARCAFSTSEVCPASRRLEQDRLMKEMSESIWGAGGGVGRDPGPGVSYGVFRPLSCFSRPQPPCVYTMMTGTSRHPLQCHGAWLLHGSGQGWGPQNTKLAAEIGSLESETETDSGFGVLRLFFKGSVVGLTCPVAAKRITEAVRSKGSLSAKRLSVTLRTGGCWRRRYT